MSSPVFSIITATRQCATELALTIDSIRNQSFRDFEYIVIDGASTDDTASLLQASESVVTCWISEPDFGISDAFNKGVRIARGRWVLFLGAGDTLAGAEVLAHVYKFVTEAGMPPFFYGDVIYDYGDRTRNVHQNYNWSRFCHYSCIPHQAMFLDRGMFDDYGMFDTAYRICMDYEHTARFIREVPPLFMDTVVAFMPRTGVSTNPWLTHAEMNQVRRQHRLAGSPAIFLSWCPILLKAAWCFVSRTHW